MPKLALAEALSVTSESRKYRDLVTAASGYGLTKGSYAAPEVELLPRSKLVLDHDFDEIIATLFENDCFKSLYDRYLNASIPLETAARSFLEKECDVSPAQSEGVYRGVLRNARAWQLVQNKAGSEKFVPLDMARASASSSPIDVVQNIASPETKLKKAQEPEKVKPSVKESTRSDAGHKNNPSFKPELHIDVQIHINPETTAEQIEQIFASMSKHLRNV